MILCRPFVDVFADRALPTISTGRLAARLAGACALVEGLATTFRSLLFAFTVVSLRLPADLAAPAFFGKMAFACFFGGLSAVFGEATLEDGFVGLLATVFTLTVERADDFGAEAGLGFEARCNFACA